MSHTGIGPGFKHGNDPSILVERPHGLQGLPDCGGVMGKIIYNRNPCNTSSYLLSPLHSFKSGKPLTNSIKWKPQVMKPPYERIRS